MTRRNFLTALGGLIGLAVLPANSSAQPTTHFAISGTVIPGNGSPVLERHAVIVEEDKIQAVLPISELPSNIPHLDSGTILPGIINCHTHDVYTHEDRRNRFLLNGVTSLGNVASPLEAIPELLHSPSGRTASSTCTGPMLCPPGGYPLPIHKDGYGLVVQSPNQGREKIRELADQGVTMVKLAFEPGPYPEPWPMFDGKTAYAICNEARRLGLTIRCHVEDFSGLAPALDAGVHTIEHVPHRWIRGGKPKPLLEAGQPIQEYHHQLDRMIQENTILTPTLDVLTRSIWIGPEMFEPVRYVARQGGRIALGNDFPFRRTDAGMPLREMELLAKAGLTSTQILTAATSTSASACGFTDRGEISPGKKADLLVYPNNPLNDINELATPSMVIKDGRPVS